MPSVRLMLDPDPEHDVLEAVREAMRRAGVEVPVLPDPYRSAWRGTALATDAGDDLSPGYPPAPRSSRGATRA